MVKRVALFFLNWSTFEVDTSKVINSQNSGIFL